MTMVMKQLGKGVVLQGETSDVAENVEGSIWNNSTDERFRVYIESAVREIITDDQTQTLTNKTIVAADNTITTAASGNLAATELNAALAELQTSIDSTDTAIADHLADTADAHDASAISNQPSGNLSATDVQSALNELQTDINTRATSTELNDHITDVTDAHDASAISVVPTGNLSSINVQAALEELQANVDSVSGLADHLADVTDAHDASAISSIASGNLAATDVQSALNELQTDIDTRVEGPGSSTDNRVVRFDGTTGKLVQDGSPVTISDAGIIAGVTGVTSSGTVQSTGTMQQSGVSIHDYSTDAATTGANATLSSPTTPCVRLTNASLTSIDMIDSPSAGRVLTITNHTGSTISVSNNTGATTANRVLTGTGAALSLADEASIVVKYDGTESRWMVIGGSGSGGGGGSSNTYLQNIQTFSSSPVTLVNGDDGDLVLLNTTSTAITLNLPTSPSSGVRYVIKDVAGTFGTNAVTVTKDAGHTIEGLNSSYLLESNYGTWIFMYDGVSNWVIL